MKCDETLAFEMIDGNEVATLRTYGWNPPAISLGYNQNIEDIDVGRAERAGFEVVRRATGGRAILHAQELTYCVVMKTADASVSRMYEQISGALVAGISLLGLKVDIEKLQPHFPTLYRESSGAVCFSSSARHEIKVNGKKLVGSAQRRYDSKPAPSSSKSEEGPRVTVENVEVALQHGSILLGPAHKQLVEFLKISDAERALLRRDLDRLTTDIETELHRPISYDEAVNAIRTGFEQAWSITFERTEPEFTA
jgi:lipoate-protein ligase A